MPEIIIEEDESTIVIEAPAEEPVIVSGVSLPGQGVPSGGLTDMLLAKASDDDYDTAWTGTIDGGGA